MKYILNALILCTVFSACSENSNEHDIRVYDHAMNIGDLGVATYAIHSIIARDTSQTQFYDTLAGLYFNTGNFGQAGVTAERVLRDQPNNQRMLELAARSFQSVSRGPRALHYFERLARLSNNPEHRYQVAAQLVYANKLTEAKEIASRLTTLPQGDSIKIVILSGETRQPVPIKAAAYNILASIAYQQGNIQEAKEQISLALAVFPEFILAKQNLKNM
ncbi:MAG: hypothetical protein M3Q97_05845 [Bacteroidota bacterium]|nr:hypothetical protein [Bacteroidota bacterium]